MATIPCIFPFQHVIEQILALYAPDLNLHHIGHTVHLQHVAADVKPLSVTVIDLNQVHIGHEYIDAIPLNDPEVVIFNGYPNWIPLKLKQRQLCKELTAGVVTYDDGAKDAFIFDPTAHEAIAFTLNLWAKNFHETGWLDPQNVKVRDPWIGMYPNHFMPN